MQVALLPASSRTSHYLKEYERKKKTTQTTPNHHNIHLGSLVKHHAMGISGNVVSSMTLNCLTVPENITQCFCTGRLLGEGA